MTAPAPILGIISHRDRVFVATTEGVYELVGNKLHRLEFSEIPPEPMYPTSFSSNTLAKGATALRCSECWAVLPRHVGGCARATAL